jgi:hypothetical protein
LSQFYSFSSFSISLIDHFHILILTNSKLAPLLLALAPVSGFTLRKFSPCTDILARSPKNGIEPCYTFCGRWYLLPFNNESCPENGYSSPLVPQNYQKLESEEHVKLMKKLIDIMEDDDDVQNIWHNWEE